MGSERNGELDPSLPFASPSSPSPSGSFSQVFDLLNLEADFICHLVLSTASSQVGRSGTKLEKDLKG